MLKIRLARGGAKKRPYYSIVIADSHSPRDGRFIEKVGSYDPLKRKDDPSRLTLKVERIQEWLKKGAQPTDRVARELSKQGLTQWQAGNNPKKGEPGAKAKERTEARAQREADRAAAAAEAAAAPAVEEAPAEAPVEEAAVEETAAAQELAAETAEAPVAEARPVEPGITSTAAPTRGKLPKAAVDATLASAQPGIQACYEAGLKRKPDLRGQVSTSLVVAPDGKVAHVEALEGDDALPDPATVDCILAQLKKLVFPEPSGGRVFLNYPLQLEPPK